MINVFVKKIIFMLIVRWNIVLIIAQETENARLMVIVNVSQDSQEMAANS
jgi:hypothetical protein